MDRLIVLKIANGATIAEVAKDMNYAYQTIKNRLRKLYKRYEVHSEVELLGILIREGLIELEGYTQL